MSYSCCLQSHSQQMFTVPDNEHRPLQDSYSPISQIATPHLENLPFTSTVSLLSLGVLWEPDKSTMSALTRDTEKCMDTSTVYSTQQ